MALPSSGAISFSQINTELNFTSTAQLSIDSSAARTLAGVPSGTISLSNFYGKSNFSFTTDTAVLGAGPIAPGASYSYPVVYTRTAGSGSVTPTLASYPSGFTAGSASWTPSSVTLNGTTTTGTITYTITVPAGTPAGTYTWVWNVGATGAAQMTWNVNVSSALETKTVNVGYVQINVGGYWEPNYVDYYGFSDSFGLSFGSMSPNTTTNLWTPAGRWGQIFYSVDSYGFGTVYLVVWSAVGYGATPNNGWTSMSIGGQTFDRTSATYFGSTSNSNPYGDGNRRYSSWAWNNISSNPFGTSGSKTVSWS